VLTEWRRLEPRRRRKILAPLPAEFSTARRLKPARQPDFTAASRKRLGGAAEGSSPAPTLVLSIGYFCLYFHFMLRSSESDIFDDVMTKFSSTYYYQDDLSHKL